MSDPWKPERAVTADEARALVSAQFPELRDAPVIPFGEGWDNTAFLVGELVFRFPRRTVAVQLLQTEARVLPRIASSLPLPIPVPCCFGEPADSYPWPFVGYPLLPGRTATAAALDDAQRGACAVPMARFLAALHAIPTEPLALPPDAFSRLDPALGLPKARASIATITRQGSHPDPALLLAAVEAAASELPAARAHALVHGDLYTSHLLVDERAAPAGVIDWGDVHLGDPAVDLSFAHGFLPPAAHDAFRRAYGEVDEATWRLARYRALKHALYELAYAHDIGAADAMREARASLARLL
jgi:aminoglycoside phosphotransferase (APT) family kinase protein